MRRIAPDMPPEVARRIAIEESGDLKARFKLLDLAELAFNEGRRGAFGSLMHACDYLKDREEYERNPHPKGMVKLTIPLCRHGKGGTLRQFPEVAGA